MRHHHALSHRAERVGKVGNLPMGLRMVLLRREREHGENQNCNTSGGWHKITT